MKDNTPSDDLHLKMASVYSGLHVDDMLIYMYMYMPCVDCSKADNNVFSSFSLLFVSVSLSLCGVGVCDS